MAWDLRPDTDPELVAGLEDAFTPRVACGGPYSPHTPHPKQQVFLLMDDREVLFGGAAGGGKSDSLLMGALQYVCVPGYAAILFRQTYPQLAGEGGLIDRAMDWLSPQLGEGSVKWNLQRKRFTFYPSGATMSFGHLWLEKDRLNYQSLAYQYVGFDEGTHWATAKSYKYVGFSRVRRPAPDASLPACPGCGLTLADVPLRTRMGTNPGGPGHGWVRHRFLLEAGPGRIFIPAKLEDNPSLDAASYAESLMELDVVERERLLSGDWTITEEGRLFSRSWFVGTGVL